MLIFFGEKIEYALGFRLGDKGTHSSRTMMLAELTSVLNAVPSEGCRKDYVDAVVEGNCLRKPTTSTRRLSLQRLSELYALDPEIPIFRVLRLLWDADPASRPLLAILDSPFARSTLDGNRASHLPLAEGLEMPRKSMTEGLRKKVAERLSDATLDKVIRNTASSWSQSGHLSGRTFKIRQRVQPTPRAVAFALYLGVGCRFPWRRTPGIWVD